MQVGACQAQLAASYFCKLLFVSFGLGAAPVEDPLLKVGQLFEAKKIAFSGFIKARKLAVARAFN